MHLRLISTAPLGNAESISLILKALGDILYNRIMKRFSSSMCLTIGSLVAANLVPILWSRDGNVGNLLLLYWLETWIIGFYNVFKIQKASGLISQREERVMKIQLFGKMYQEVTRKSITVIFAVQYSVVIFLYGALLFGLFVPTFFANAGSGNQAITSNFTLSFLAFFFSHGVSFFVNYLGKKEYLVISPAHQMLQPYDRIIAMHLTLILGTMILGTVHNIIIAPNSLFLSVVGIILIKLFADLATHIKEHMIRDATESTNQNLPGKGEILFPKILRWAAKIIITLIVVILVVRGIGTFHLITKRNNRQIPVQNLPQTKIEPTDTLASASAAIQTKASSEFHIVFISDHYTDFSAFFQDAQLMQQYLLSREPFTEFAAIFRFHTLENSADLGCDNAEWNVKEGANEVLELLNCDGEKIIQIVENAGIPYTRIIVLSNNSKLRMGGSIAGFNAIEWGGIPSNNNIAIVNTSLSEQQSKQFFVHEFAHTFGLQDEYLLFAIPGSEGNNCIDNCCASSQCVDWKDMEGAECIPGCSYPNWYRSSLDSTMKSSSAEYFNVVSLDILRRRLRKFTDPELVTGSGSWNWNIPRPTNPGAVAGDTMSFTGESWNRGAIKAGPSVMSGRLDVGDDGKWDITFSTAQIAALAPDVIQTHLWSDAWIASAGAHRLEVCVDVANTVKEADEKNNCKSWDFTVREKQAD